jgi:clathrin heavy chain
LGQAQLNANKVVESIDSYVRADDPSNYQQVIQAADRAQISEELIRYLLMARKKLREAAIDGELLFAYARTNRLADMEEFLAGHNLAKVTWYNNASLH